MRRVLPAGRVRARGSTAFLPGIPRDGARRGSSPAVVTDPTDPKLAHLDGLNLSRAWMLEGIASGLPRGDPRRPALRAAATRHREAGLRAVTGEHYEGGHWLGSFRGLPHHGARDRSVGGMHDAEMQNAECKMEERRLAGGCG